MKRPTLKEMAEMKGAQRIGALFALETELSKIRGRSEPFPIWAEPYKIQE